MAAISIIMTVFNRERYLERAVESVLAQTRRDFELLIWDDGSTDRSVEIARDYAKLDDRVRVTASEHRGRTPALKAAIAETSGDYLGWVDSDESGRARGYGRRCRIPYSRDRLLLDFMTFHFRLIRRSVFDRVGGIDESFECAEDYDLCLRLSEAAEVRHVKKPLYYYRSHRESVSHRMRVEQIQCARRAIARALKRRGLADRFEVDVQIRGRFSLRQRR